MCKQSTVFFSQMIYLIFDSLGKSRWIDDSSCIFVHNLQYRKMYLFNIIYTDLFRDLQMQKLVIMSRTFACQSVLCCESNILWSRNLVPVEMGTIWTDTVAFKGEKFLRFTAKTVLPTSPLLFTERCISHDKNSTIIGFVLIKTCESIHFLGFPSHLAFSECFHAMLYPAGSCLQFPCCSSYCNFSGMFRSATVCVRSFFWILEVSRGKK